MYAGESGSYKPGDKDFADVIAYFGIGQNQDDNKEQDKGKKEDKEPVYKPVPQGYKKEGLPGFPGSKPLPNKEGARPSWDLGKTRPGGDPELKVPKGWWGEWDSKRGEIEVYDNNGKHKGAYDPETGRFKGRADPKRRPTYNKIETSEPDWESTPQSPSQPPVRPNPIILIGGAIITVVGAIFMLAGG
ncbi:colicin E3/pyocin S6 family cytotoxin [Pedobacter sp. ASV12]|uniref:colicin E3/pyocin S6 family cytotoxin n=1 Tax=Pedobacter sp. ASV12 TaxID=2795120 RepID=UPI001E5C15CA|nr:colicin E3/pyocin S6 family cytotoxin [Pedobacter sp. ASV12]